MKHDDLIGLKGLAWDSDDWQKVTIIAVAQRTTPSGENWTDLQVTDGSRTWWA